eukprot:1138839-Pelagomonas_calceolata.AAC.4
MAYWYQPYGTFQCTSVPNWHVSAYDCPCHARLLLLLCAGPDPQLHRVHPAGTHGWPGCPWQGGWLTEVGTEAKRVAEASAQWTPVEAVFQGYLIARRL